MEIVTSRTTQQEGIVRHYRAPRMRLEPAPSIRVQDRQELPDRHDGKYAPGTCSSYYGGSFVMVSRQKAAEVLWMWRREGRKIERTRSGGTHIAGGFKLRPTVGWRNRHWHK